jgi:pantetheine-phosphate adenylyltransferase
VHRAVCPGSFDPVTNGHLDIIARAAQLFDEVIVAVGVNASKNRLFTPQERMGMLAQAVAEHDNVRVESFTGLLTTFCEERGVAAIVKGLRAVNDFDYELQMAQMNAHLTGVETVFVPSRPQYSFLASSRCCGTRWCSRCRSSRCARTTVPACVPSAGHAWPRSLVTRTRRRSTRGGRASRP